MSPKPPSQRTGMSGLSLLHILPWVVWAVLFNLVGLYTWNYGWLTFLCLTGAAGFLFFLPGLLSWAYRHIPAVFKTRHSGIATLVLLALILSGLQIQRQVQHGFTGRPDWVVDIADNTHAAGSALLAGRNPYTSKAQLNYTFQPGLHVESVNGRIKLYGVDYFYGFPYFPMMAMMYLPLRTVVSGYTVMRLTNGLLFLLNLIGVFWLMTRLVPEDEGRLAAWTAVLAYICVWVYMREIITYAITDIAISTLALYAFIALVGQRHWTAGILLGLAQACKLLPGPFLILPVLLLWHRKEGFYQILLGYLITSTVILLPFLIWQPAAFLSSTVLFYLVNHSVGDSTSLWYFLPKMMRPVFSIGGMLLTLAMVFSCRLRRQEAAVNALTIAFLGYILFMAFSKMTHLNYLWAVYPLGCVALAATTADTLARPQTPAEAKLN